MSQLGPSGSFLSETLSQTHGDALTEASQPAVDGGDDGLPSQGDFGLYGYASQGSQMDFDFKEGAASQQSEWAHVVPGQLDDADATAGACVLGESSFGFENSMELLVIASASYVRCSRRNC